MKIQTSFSLTVLGITQGTLCIFVFQATPEVVVVFFPVSDCYFFHAYYVRFVINHGDSVDLRQFILTPSKYCHFICFHSSRQNVFIFLSSVVNVHPFLQNFCMLFSICCNWLFHRYFQVYNLILQVEIIPQFFN